MSERCDFDDALPRFVSLVVRHLGREALREHVFLRDAVGRLTLVLRGEDPRRRYASQLGGLIAGVGLEVAPYVDAMVVATPDELFDRRLAEPEVGLWERHVVADQVHAVRVVERWLVGQDWLTPPQPVIEGVAPILVFASHKGGVGRSTALVVAAADLAGRGKNVLALDLDLEAPGLGAMLLPEERRPPFGALDFFVENGLGALDDEFFAQVYGVSSLTRGQGLVHVVPAVGARSLGYPQNVLGKLSRAYLEDPGPMGPKGFLAQTRDLIAGLSARQKYDVILVDTRAGLHETTAATILGLGAQTLLFGVDTPQTFEGYRFLFAHMTRFIAPEIADGWRWQLQMVHAKALADPKRWRGFNDRVYELFQTHLYDAASDVDEGEGDSQTFVFSPDDPEAPHHPWRIFSDSNYAEFDPPTAPEQLEEPIYGRTFGSFLSALRERVFTTGSRPEFDGE